MTAKKDVDKSGLLLYCIPAILATLVFSLYHFSKLKQQYLTGPNVRRVFDIGAQGAALVASGFFGFFCYVVGVLLYDKAPREILQNPPQCLVHVSMQWHPHRP